MPTESAFIFAGLLFLAAAMGYVFARFGEPDDGPEDDRAAGGALRNLLNRHTGRADHLDSLREGDERDLDTRFALGALFRKRGEVERAIQVHRALLEGAELDESQRHRAELALADDYLSAGLYDHAEELLQPLCDTRETRVPALQRLVRAAEHTSDWERAIEAARRLERADSNAVHPAQLAHYFCEMAEQALARKAFERARGLLEHAAEAGTTVRIRWLSADLIQATGNQHDALQAYRSLVSDQPWLLIDLLPTLARISTEADQCEALDGWLAEFCEHDAGHARGVATAAALHPDLDLPAAMRCLERFLADDPILAGLVGIGPDTRLPAADLERVRAALHRLLGSGPRYRCENCGYTGMAMQWQCPGCYSWETVRPLSGIRLRRPS